MSTDQKRVVGYGVLGIFAALLVIVPPSMTSGDKDGISWTEAIAYFGPIVVVSAWKVFGTVRDAAWKLDAPANKDVNKLARENVSAPLLFVLLLGLLVEVFHNPQLTELVQKTNGTLVSLIVLYPWLGLVRAVLATTWKKPKA